MTINHDNNTVFLVYAQEDTEYPEASWVVEVLGTEEEAKKYVEIYNSLEENSYNHYYEKKEIKKFDVESKIADYYCYSADIEWIEANDLRKCTWIPEADRLCLSDRDLEEKYNHPDNNRIQDEETYKELDKGDLYVELDDYGHYKHIAVYSKNSLKEAREKCLELWEKEMESLKGTISSKGEIL